ncbi:S9 family peptidase [Gilvimarinus sp. DA14]|uniref:alpha/beta hydrolase family protein n=1 Tax=Gilvimarinus sp. DA14 TaxID=2956798 RepID=UPI0020B82FA7|nr:alpha/beta fold hydrolase [Gilvimarinus sp. DA14]UTF61108.1 prolyl oligopeptidase family serine peptidase [Gilvimarinus sp. DA14]
MENYIKTLTRCVQILTVTALTHTANAADGAVQDAASSNEVMSIEQVVSAYGVLPQTQQMRVSPDGSLLAFRKVTAEKDLVVVYSLKENKLVTGVNVGDIDPGYLYFLDDEHLVLVASENMRLAGYRGRHDISSAFVLNVSNGELDQLLRPGDVIAKGQTGLGSIVGTSDNNKYLYMPAYVAESKADRSPDYSLMRVNLESPRRPRQIVKGEPDTRDYFMDGQGNLLAEEIYDNGTNLHEIDVPDGDGGWKTIFSRETALYDYSMMAVTADLKSLVFLDTDESTGREGYFTMSLADGSISQEPIGRSDADVAGLLTDINRIAYGVIYSGFKPSYQMFDPAHQARVDSITEQFPDQHLTLTDWSPDWKRLVFMVQGGASAGTYYLSSEGKKLRYLSSAYGEISDAMVNPTVLHTYKARDGLSIPTILTLPSSRAENPRKMPAVIMPHGGPAAYDSLSFDWMAQALAARGYLVVQPQFRGSVGFGLDHYMAGQGEWGRKMQDDITDAVEYFGNGGLLDPEHVCIVGASYGGYAALAGAAYTPELYSCAVSINGVTDLEGLLDDRRSSGGDDHWVVEYFERSMVKGEYTEDDLKAISPLFAADKVKAPVLLIHGENDKVVPIEQSEDMHDELKDAGKESTFIELDNESHYLQYSKTRQQTLKAILEFVDPYLSDS